MSFIGPKIFKGLIQFWWEFNAGIDFLEFKPSEIAAAVAIFVAEETQAIDVEKAMSFFVLVEKVLLVVPTKIKDST